LKIWGYCQYIGGIAEALRGHNTAQETAAKHKIHPTQVTTWKRQAFDGLTGVFSDKVRKAESNEARTIPPKIHRLIH